MSLSCQPINSEYYRSSSQPATPGITLLDFAALKLRYHISWPQNPGECFEERFTLNPRYIIKFLGQNIDFLISGASLQPRMICSSCISVGTIKKLPIKLVISNVYSMLRIPWATLVSNPSHFLSADQSVVLSVPFSFIPPPSHSLSYSLHLTILQPFTANTASPRSVTESKTAYDIIATYAVLQLGERNWIALRIILWRKRTHVRTHFITVWHMSSPPVRKKKFPGHLH